MMDDFDVEDLQIKDMKAEFLTGENSFTNMFVDVSGVVHSSEDELIDDDPLSEKRRIVETDKCTKENLQQLPQCKNGCHLKITELDRQQTLDAYSKKKEFQSRFNFVADMIVMLPTMIHDKRSPSNHKQMYSTTFYIQTTKGVEKICKTCLTLTLKETNSFISTVLVQKIIKLNKMLQFKEEAKKKQQSLNPEVIVHEAKKAENPNIEVQIVTEKKSFVATPYLTRDFKLRKGWTRIPLEIHACKDKCFLKILEIDQKRIFDSYWREATFHSRLRFIKSMTLVSNTICSDQIDGHRNPEYNAIYYLNTKNGAQQVCRTCFQIAIDESDKFITEVLDDKWREISRIEESKKKRLHHLGENAELLNPPMKNRREPFDILDDGMRLIWTPLLRCRNKCYLKVTEADQIRTFDIYRQALTLLERYNFFMEMTDIIPKKLPDMQNSRKLINASAIYYLNTKEGRTRVCKSCFRQTINEADFLTEACLDEKWRQIAALNQSNDATAQLEDLVRKPIIEAEKQIQKFPLFESQDFKSQVTEKYLPMGLSLEIMYDLYVQEVRNPVSIDDYQKIVNLMNLKFEPALEKCKSSKGIKEKISLNCHLVASVRAQKLKSMNEIKAPLSNNLFVFCSFGLKKSLPTPWLNDPTAFYKRPFWIHFLTIYHHSDNNQGNHKFYMWNETQGNKTTNEIASCLYEYLLNLPPTVKYVTVCSNFGCQESRRKALSVMFSHLVANHKTLETIEHKFHVCNYYSQCDGDLDNRLTEIMREYQGKIQHPNDWYNAFRKPLDSNNIPEVVVMTPEKFYDFESHRKDPLEVDEPFIDKEVEWMQYTKEGVVCRNKSRFSKGYRFKVADLKLRSQCEAVWKATLRNLSEIPLSKERKDDLLDLLPLMSPDVKSFYEGLPVQKDISLDKSLGSLQEKGESSGKKVIDEVSNPKKNCRIRRSRKPLPPCDEKCHVKIPNADQIRIFNWYSQKKSFESKLDFVSDMIEINSITPEIQTTPKMYYTTYFLNTEEGGQNVCRNCFVYILGEQDSFITKVLEEKFQEIDESNDLPEENPKTRPETPECEIIDEKHSSISNDDIIGRFVGKTMPDESKYLAEENQKTRPETVECEIIDEKVSSISSDDIFIETVVGKTMSEYYELKESKRSSRNIKKIHERAKTGENSNDELINESFSNKYYLTPKNDEKILTVKLSPLVEKVKNHIKKFPLTEQRSEKYLPLGLTAEVMYNLYVKEVCNPVNINFYKKVLAQTDLKLKPLILDKCETCNAALQMLRTVDDPNERYKIDSLQTAHLFNSQTSYNSKLRDEEAARKFSAIHVCSFAVQSSLPTPCLNEPLTYYQLPLWTYNLIVEHQINDKTEPRMKSHSYMWHEGDGKGTANEIASCLYQYLQKLPPTIKSVIIYSTCCNGEARSKTLSWMFSHCVSNHKTLKTVDHKFLVSGHSEIEERLDKQWIELINNHRGEIEVPDDWYQAANSNTQSSLVIMNPEKLYDFESLWKVNGAKSFIVKKIKWLRYVKQGMVYYKKSLNETDPFHILNLNSEFKDVSNVGLSKLRHFPVTEKKKNGLLNLLFLMSLKARCFYERLPVKNNLMGEAKKKPSLNLKRNLRKILPMPNCIIKDEVHILENGDLDYLEEESDEPAKKISKKRDFIQLNAISMKETRMREAPINNSHSLRKFLT